MQDVHQVRVSHLTPEGLALDIPGGNLDFNAVNPGVTHPAHGFFDELPRDSPSPALGTNAQVGDLGALGLLEDRRGAVDPDNADAFDDRLSGWNRRSGVKYKDHGIRITSHRAKKLSKFTFGNGPTAHSEKRIEAGVVLGHQSPQSCDAIDLLHPRNAHSSFGHDP